MIEKLWGGFFVLYWTIFFTAFAHHRMPHLFWKLLCTQLQRCLKKKKAWLKCLKIYYVETNKQTPQQMEIHSRLNDDLHNMLSGIKKNVKKRNDIRQASPSRFNSHDAKVYAAGQAHNHLTFMAGTWLFYLIPWHCNNWFVQHHQNICFNNNQLIGAMMWLFKWTFHWFRREGHGGRRVHLWPIPLLAAALRGSQ